MRRRLSAIVGVACLALAPLPALASAHAAVRAASVPVACANVVSSTTVYVDDVISFGPPPGGCTVVSNSSSGNLDRVSDTGFVAFAVGSGTMTELLTDGTTSYLNQVNVTILERPPSPTPTPTATATATTTASASASSTTSATASQGLAASGTPTSAPTDPPVFVAATPPKASQQLSRKDITPTAGPLAGQVVFLDSRGSPLQLLAMTGDTSGMTVARKGMNYSTRPTNWQRLGYGDLCWSYAGYSDVQGFVLPVATPPFSTVPANWILSAAIVGTTSGNVTYLDPSPGQVVDAGGRDVATLTLCANGVANAVEDGGPSTRAKTIRPAKPGGGSQAWCHVPPGQGPNGAGHLVGGGGGHANHPYDYPASAYGGQCLRGLPVLNPPTSTGSNVSSPSASTSRPPEPTVPICQATTDATRPYVTVAAVPLSQLPTPPASGELLYPDPGWSSIIPKTDFYPGQNWTTAGREIFDRGCTVVPPTPTAEPTLTPTPLPPTSPASPTPLPVYTPALDPQVPVCRATKDPTSPYRVAVVRSSEITGTGGDRLYPTAGWTDILPPAPNLPTGQNWPAGEALLFGTTSPCQITVVEPLPVQSITGLSPGPQATSAPDVTGFSPAVVVTPLPQPSFTGYGPVTPWPPLQPLPLKGSGKGPDAPKYLTPSPYPTPPSPSPTLTPSATSPSPYPTPPSPSPQQTPPSPTVTVTTITQPSFIDYGPVCGSGPCVVTPVLPPSTTFGPMIELTPATAVATPTPSDTGTPTEGTPTASTTATQGAPATGKVTLVLTNGPDTVTYTTTVATLTNVAKPGGTTTNPPGELATTGSGWAAWATTALVLLGLAFLLLPRVNRRRS